MRRVAIIGSGIIGLLTAHGLLKAGYSVTLFSDRSADDWLHRSKPTGTAARFELAYSWDRELGLAHWEAEVPHISGAHLTLCLERGNRLLTMVGRLPTAAYAIDVRLMSHRWMGDLVARGGEVVIEPVTVARLDEIAAAHDLTIVAAGRGDLCELFERDAARSAHAAPQRKLALIICKELRMGIEGVPFLPVKFNLFAPYGEAFWVPYLHKDAGPTWNLLFEAKSGGPMDRFDGAKSGEEMIARAKEVIRDLMPWDYAWAKEMILADEHGWLLGGVAPTVRKPVGRLPSGRVVTGVGDTIMSLDPIGGQGANNGTKMARHLCAAVVARGARPFDEAWMKATFESYYEEHGRHIDRFNNMLLDPLSDAGKELLIAQYGSDGRSRGGRQAIADAFTYNFCDPRTLTPALEDMGRAREIIERHTGQPWLVAAARGRLGIAAGQIRQTLGLPPEHA